MSNYLYFYKLGFEEIKFYSNQDHHFIHIGKIGINSKEVNCLNFDSKDIISSNDDVRKII